MHADSAIVQEMDESSLYFLRQDPQLVKLAYGENQKRYREFSKQVVEDLLCDIHFAKEMNQQGMLLSQILPSLGILRKKIALELGSIDAEDFGSLRSEAKTSNATILSGPLYNKAANDLIHSFIQALFKILPKPFSSFEEMIDETSCGIKYPLSSSQSIITNTFITARTSFDIESITGLIFGSKNGGHSMLRILFPDRTPQGAMIPLDPERWACFLQALEYYKKTATPPENTKSIYYHIEISLIEKNSPILSDILLRFDIDSSIPPVANIAPPLILHMKTGSIQSVLHSIDQDIENLLMLPPLASIETIIDTIALIRYKFAHALPFVRGSAAVGEWIETALYRYMGFQNFRQSASTTIDLEVFSSLSFEEFLYRYRAIIDQLNLIRIQSEPTF